MRHPSEEPLWYVLVGIRNGGLTYLDSGFAVLGSLTPNERLAEIMAGDNDIYIATLLGNYPRYDKRVAEYSRKACPKKEGEEAH